MRLPALEEREDRLARCRWSSTSAPARCSRPRSPRPSRPRTTGSAAASTRRAPAAACSRAAVASSLTVASSRSCGTTRFTRPMRSASAASITSARSTSSLARCMPTRRGSSHDPPKSTTRPRLAKISLNRARSEATIRSQPSARLQPAPAATPLTAAIVGLASSCRRERGLPDDAHPGQRAARRRRGRPPCRGRRDRRPSRSRRPRR